MDVPTSVVGYTPAMPRTEDHEVHKDMWWHWTEKKLKHSARSRNLEYLIQKVTQTHWFWLVEIKWARHTQTLVLLPKFEKIGRLCMLLPLWEQMAYKDIITWHLVKVLWWCCIQVNVSTAHDFICIWFRCKTNPGGRTVCGEGLRTLDYWDRGFESRWGHGCLSLLFVVYCVGSGVCDELITCPEESYRVCVCVCVCVRDCVLLRDLHNETV